MIGELNQIPSRQKRNPKMAQLQAGSHAAGVREPLNAPMSSDIFFRRCVVERNPVRSYQCGVRQQLSSFLKKQFLLVPVLCL